MYSEIMHKTLYCNISLCASVRFPEKPKISLVPGAERIFISLDHSHGNQNCPVLSTRLSKVICLQCSSIVCRGITDLIIL